uniref:Uncharacterized protein n=1 Tax=Pararge aegeria TaxID=116150 RepID=S4PXM7_9NEOP
MIAYIEKIIFYKYIQISIIHPFSNLQKSKVNKESALLRHTLIKIGITGRGRIYSDRHEYKTPPDLGLAKGNRSIS